MHLHTRNVNTAFRTLVELFNDVRHHGMIGGPADQPIIVKKSSRNGNVMMIDEPVMITYSHPKERVLFNQARDCNPFFHLYEAMWMLAGRNDVAPLAYYASKMKDFSDDGLTFNGAYGYRWRKEYIGTLGRHVDQLNILVNHLKADHQSRRAVLQMWNVEDDLLKIGRKCYYCGETGTVADDIDGKTVNGLTCPKCSGHSQRGSKDVCCNTSVMFSLRESVKAADLSSLNLSVEETARRWGTTAYELDMTVTNRSNDMIWGMLGADFVDFSFLQEYVAARLGVEVGRYNHFTNNLHVYDWNWKPEKWLLEHERLHDEYASMEDGKQLRIVPLVKDPAQFEKELPQIVEMYSGKKDPETCNDVMWKEPFLADVVEPVLRAFKFHKIKQPILALNYAKYIKADDWRTACTNWITKRMK